MHCHVLPKIDDGASDIDESIGLLKLLKEQGVSTVVLTPHFYPDQMALEEFLAIRERAFNELRKESFDISLILASETLISESLFAYEDISDLCIGGTEYLLLELPYQREWGQSIYRTIDRLIATYVITPVIAHIERYEPVWRNPGKTMDTLLEIGCFLQMNIDSLLDRHSARFALKMVKKGYIDLIGSDCHNLSNRAPRFDEFKIFVQKKLGMQYLKQWEENAGEIIKESRINVL